MKTTGFYLYRAEFEYSAEMGYKAIIASEFERLTKDWSTIVNVCTDLLHRLRESDKDFYLWVAIYKLAQKKTGIDVPIQVIQNLLNLVSPTSKDDQLLFNRAKHQADLLQRQANDNS